MAPVSAEARVFGRRMSGRNGGTPPVPGAAAIRPYTRPFIQ